MSGSYPLQLQGGPYLPQRLERAQNEGTIEELSKLSNLSERLARHSRVRRRARPGGLPEMEAEDGGQPLVIDKTKEIQTSIYPVYITTKSVAVPCTDQRTDQPY